MKPGSGSTLTNTIENISTISGNGLPGYSGDNGPAIDAAIDSPYGVAIDPAGNIYFSESSRHRVRKIDTDGNDPAIIL